MRARDAITPISLVVLAAGAAAYAYVVDRGTISDADRAARRGEAFPSFRVDQVARVELDQNGQSLVLERDRDSGASGWLIASPQRDRADAAEVDALLRELELARRLRDVPESDPLGLASPRVRGRVNVGPIEYRFALGADAPRPEGAAYMQVDGDGTFVVGRTLKVQLLRGWDAYRDRVLVSYGASETARVEVKALTGGAAGFAIERRGATFRVVGSGLRASRGSVDELFAALGDTRAETFLDDAEAEKAMAGTSWRVEITPRGGDREPIELRVGGDCPAQSEGIVVIRDQPSRVSACAPRTIALALGSIAGSLVDKAPLFAHADEIEELRLEGSAPSAGRVELARKDRVWRERAPEERDLDASETESANALAAALAGARATDARPATARDRFAVYSRATIVRTGGGVSEVVEVGAAQPDGSALMRRKDDDAVLRVPLAAARRFWPKPVALRGRSVWRPVRSDRPEAVVFDAAAVTAVDDSCGAARQRLELRNRVWRMRSPSGYRADAPSIVDLIDAFVHAKAEAWLTDADDGTFGLGSSDACEVSFTLDDGSDGGERKGIAFGAAGDGGVYARVLDDKAVFVAPTALRELASRPAIDRARFRMDPASLDSVILLRNGRRLAFSRADDGPGPHLVPATGARAGTEDLEAALAGFSAQAAVHLGPPAQDEGFSVPTLEIRIAARPDAGPAVETRIAIGGATRVGGLDAYFARVGGVDATFAVPRRAVLPLLDTW